MAESPQPEVDQAEALLDDFASATGLEGAGKPRRYLWTDAFAVCTWLGLWTATGDLRLRRRAVALVDQVHHVLGRHRTDDPRSGWISGLDEATGEERPTAGGLRIGKELPERGPGEPLERDLEWHRDGQYYHYLTRWMIALDRLAVTTGDETAHRWAVELADAANAAFTRLGDDGLALSMAWKMSVDLERVLVPSMGQHDPLDGLVTILVLQGSPLHGEAAANTDLTVWVDRLGRLCVGARWNTADTLGAGGLLVDAWRLAALVAAGRDSLRELLDAVLEAAVASVVACRRSAALDLPVEHRLAFRELGLAIGLAAAERMLALDLRDDRVSARLEVLDRHRALGADIVDFWLEPGHRRVPSWTGHADINTVMLAASLAPDGYLGTSEVP